MFGFGSKNKKTSVHLLSDLLASGAFKATPINLIGGSPTRKSRFIANVFAPMAVEAGESFSILRQSEGLLLEECIKEHSVMGHSILSVTAQKNKELTEHVVEIIGKQAVTRPTHVIIRYPDDADFFESHADSEVKFLTACMGSFFRSKAAPLEGLSELTSVTPEELNARKSKKAVPIYLGDADRYLIDNDFVGYTYVALSQLRSLKHQSFVNINVHDKGIFDKKVWEMGMANSCCRILIESDISKGQTVCGELKRYVDANFHDECSEFGNCHSLAVGSEKLCAIFADDKGVIKPHFIKLA